MSIANTRIPIEGTSNLRDLGGYPASNGMVIAPRRLFRSEVLVAKEKSEIHGVWNATNADQIKALGIRTVIDLRAVHEVEKTPSSWKLATGAEVVELPIAEGGEGTDTSFVRRLITGEMTQFSEFDMAQFYRDTLDRRAATFAAAVGILAEEGRVPALVHCAAGKDRTGLLIALVLEVLGTPRTITVADYALTGEFRSDRVQAYAPLLKEAGVELDSVRVLFETPASAMESALAHLDEHHGGATGYLLSTGGVKKADLDRLRAALLVRPQTP
jgi:protein-tyrosine phosphatase